MSGTMVAVSIIVLSWLIVCHDAVSNAGSVSTIMKNDKIKSYAQQAFSYAKYYESNMVLQRSPHRANIWGYAPASDVGSTVTLTVSKASTSLRYSAVVKPGFAAGSDGVWLVTLDEFTEPGPFVITASLKNYQPIVLENVLFGDVWVCSGQSNMKLQMSSIINSTEEIADGAKYSSVRFFSVGQVLSATPLYDVTKVEIHWSLPTKVTLPPFSAVCFLYGKYLYQSLGVPIGLVESSWGGTDIEMWSSQDSLRECGLAESDYRISPSVIREVPWDSQDIPGAYENMNIGDGNIYYAMIHPLQNMSIYGIIWYQGENNVNRNRHKYNCTFPAMIHDWRNKWYDGSLGQTDPIFPFGFVQLGPWRPADAITGWSEVRMHQTADVGYVPNNKMINVFMCVAVDLFDPVGLIHFRDKMTVAKRLTLSGLSIAYGKTGFRFLGPIPTVLILDTAASTLRIIYDDGKLPLTLRNTSGFEVCCRSDKLLCDIYAVNTTGWTITPAKQVDKSTVVLSVKGCSGLNVMGLRYLWRETPCPYKQAAVYAAEGDLPAGEFLYEGYIGHYSVLALNHSHNQIYIQK